MGKYKKPRKLNPVSFLLLLLVLAAGYAGFQFGPAYYRKWRAKGILSDSANRAYPKRFKEGWERDDAVEVIRKSTVKQLQDLGINDPELQVKIEFRAKEISATATYKVVVKHPLVNKITTLYFRPHSEVSAGERPF